MKTFALEVWDDSFSLVTYYTVRWDEAEESETDKFIRRYKDVDTHREHFTEIFLLLEDLGKRKGAKKEYFQRYVNEANELPPKKKIEIEGIEIKYYENVFRLFCTRINDNIVILFNGGIKSSQATQDSPELANFREAEYFAKRIWEEILDKYGAIEIDEARHKLLNSDGSDEELLIY